MTETVSSKTKYMMSNLVFKGKNVPDFITRDKIFSDKPVKIKKVFPSIGLPNFKEITKITKPLLDFKKENTFVYAILRDIHSLLTQYYNNVSTTIDEWQYLIPKEEKDKAREKILELNAFTKCISDIMYQTNPYTPEMSNIIRIDEGKVSLKLFKEVLNSDQKLIFKKDSALFKAYIKIVSKLREYNINGLVDLETLDSFKVFSKENISCKDYSIIFSSDKEAGAWDLLTMSMRGIRSCQRWDGEYRYCVIGSILSKFIGIVYITSGVNVEGYGSKMLKRCLVRYVIDANTSKPAILLDKMYPDFDEDVLSAFIQSLQSKTSIPVLYAPKLGRSIHKYYVPFEELREKIPEAKWSYQDSTLRSNIDENIYDLVSNIEVIRSETSLFYNKFMLHLSKQIYDTLFNKDISNKYDDLKPLFRDLNSNTLKQSLSTMTNSLMNTIQINLETNINKSYSEYLFNLILKMCSKKKYFKQSFKQAILQHAYDYSTEPYSDEIYQKYLDFVVDTLIKFSKQQYLLVKNEK